MSKLKSTHEGKLILFQDELNVAVLNDGSRIITQNAVFKAFGRTRRGRKKDEMRVLNMPAFLDAKNLQGLISEELKDVLNSIEYLNKKNKLSKGYDANILALICKLYLDARAKKKLLKQQLPLARASEILLIALSKTGVTSLIDEVTGYQSIREKEELQRLLEQYLTNDLMPWQKRFPDVFYKELFRLNGWDYTVSGINKRPGVIGTWTKTLVYEQLPKGILAELKKNIPTNSIGSSKAKLHQLLTEDVGSPQLIAQINKVVTLFQLSDNMGHMWSQFKKLQYRQKGQIELPFNFDFNGFTIE
ncbi:MAG: P63C domain-containing protein [Cytophagales bacterium]|nr:P63C domain-containing protein [Cytophagales bacterium]